MVTFPAVHVPRVADLFGVDERALFIVSADDTRRHLASVPTADDPLDAAALLLEATFKEQVVGRLLEMSDEERDFVRRVGREFFGYQL